MASGFDRAPARRDTAQFLLCLLLSVVMLLHPSWGETATRLIRSSVLRPFLWLQEVAEASRTGRGAVDRLRSERDSAVHAAQFLPSLRAENERLRALLGLKDRLPGRYVGADVLHQALPTDGRSLVLSAGRRQGVRPFSPVVSATGLVGVVREVESDRSVAMTWAHPDFRASAFTLPGGVFGVVAPAVRSAGSDQLLQLAGVAIRDTIADGTLVVTSGLGGVYPPGIPIGSVIGHGQGTSDWERVYFLVPAARPAETSQVLVLLGGADSTLARAFEAGAPP